MTIPVVQRLKLWQLAVGVVLVWIIMSRHSLGGLFIRNLGFLQFNQVQTARNGQTNNELLQRGINYLEKATELRPDSKSAWRALGYLYLESGAEEKARAAWQHSYEMVDELFGRGAKAAATADFDAALSWYQRATAIEPGSAEAWLEIGLIYELREDWASATAAYESGIESAADNSDMLFRLARIPTQQSSTVDWGSVLSLIDEAIARDKFLYDWNRSQSHLLRGEALENSGDLQAARAEYVWLVENRPNQYWATIRLANLIWRMDQDAAATERYLQAAITMEPDIKWAYRGLAELYNDLGRSDEAGKVFKQILEMDPNDHLANQWLAQQ